MSASEHRHAMTAREVSSERVSEERSGVAVVRLTIEQVAAEALEHVKDGDSFGAAARNPTTIRTRQLLERLATDALALRSSVKTVGVKKLEWDGQIAIDAFGLSWTVYMDYGREDGKECFVCNCIDGTWPTIEAAKSAAQADYERRILSALEAPTPQEAPSEVTEEMDSEPYENTLSLAELRREVRREWDDKNELIRALKELPEVPNWRVLRLLSRAATFPEDWSIGKQLQAKHGIEAIAPRTESEKGAGLWSRLRSALTASLKGGK